MGKSLKVVIGNFTTLLKVLPAVKSCMYILRYKCATQGCLIYKLLPGK